MMGEQHSTHEDADLRRPARKPADRPLTERSAAQRHPADVGQRSFAVRPGPAGQTTARQTPPAEPLTVDPPAVTRAAAPATTRTAAAAPATGPVRGPAGAPAIGRVSRSVVGLSRQAPPRRGVDLGRAPSVLALSSLGVLLVALAYTGGRSGTSGALVMYWLGQVVVFTPVVARLLSRGVTGVPESFLLVMGLAVNQYFLKWMYSPDQLRFPDELQHWLATTVIGQTGQLFQPNPALPPAVHFPGLAEMGAAVSALTGLPVTAAGFIVAAVAHLLFVAAIYAVVLRASGSAAVAGVTCVVYATSLHYLFFNSMYLYATGALPFLMVTVWATHRWRTGGGWPFAVLAVVSMVATTATHHVTSFMMVATLILLGLSELLTGGRPRRWAALALPAVAVAVVAAWLGLVARDVIGYLEAPIDQVANTVAVLLGDRPAEGAASTAKVAVGQLAVQAAGLVVLFVLYLAFARDMVQRRDRDGWRWAALVGGGLFFAGNGVRFVGQNGPEIAGRLNTFTYVPISIVAAMALVQAVRLVPRRNAEGRYLRGGPPSAPPPATGRRQVSRIVAGSAAITLLMVGARLGGWPPTWEILPGPYLVAGYESSVDAPGVDAANWQRRVLGPGNRVSGDVTAVSLASTYGRQDPVREAGPLFEATDWTSEQDRALQTLAIDYLVVDRRLTTQLPALHAYFENEPGTNRTSPLTLQQVMKFDDLTRFDRLYDNGELRIYRTGVYR